MLYVKYGKNGLLGFRGSRLKILTDGRTQNAYIYYKLTYEPSAQVSLKVIRHEIKVARGKTVFGDVACSIRHFE